MPEPLIRSISDTARWVAFHRATESERSDAIFHDPYARRLAGERGEQIGRRLHQNAWAIAVRTFLFDSAISSLLSKKPIDMLVNLAAGLDSRPYRLELPRDLRWVEVDLPEIVEGKREMLTGEVPRCQLEVITQNLDDRARRRTLFAELNEKAECIAVMSEGLLTYLDEDKVTLLAEDLHAQDHFQYWLAEIIAPAVLDWINRKWAHHFEAAHSPMRFAPADWRRFFHDRGWEPKEFNDMASTAQKLNREPGMMKFFRILGQAFPAWNEKQSKLWESGVALLRRV